MYKLKKYSKADTRWYNNTINTIQSTKARGKIWETDEDNKR